MTILTYQAQNWRTMMRLMSQSLLLSTLSDYIKIFVQEDTSGPISIAVTDAQKISILSFLDGFFLGSSHGSVSFD